MRDEIAALYDGLELDGEDMPRAGPAELSPPGGAFLIGLLYGRAVCCGGVKRLDDQACEIKKMYVAPEARGRGVARALLSALGAARRGRSGTRPRGWIPGPARRTHGASTRPRDTAKSTTSTAIRWPLSGAKRPCARCRSPENNKDVGVRRCN